ncbi:DUF3617 domain-containing protein [Sphingomonas turrisvirgatae]|uniref:DUF3617 domain-containing protein n=1 Tax=Sphingomonas turrisvirgatae TaxID=1888892 RepID=A0A1E3LSH2_9SPHN|nr:DUF3617 domain-containing protein [Sphingomonas turrisvirgatae]ODP36693.1 hypothetical protein BFL28_05165 [Sphingomonas turrisvirgatae]
MRNAVLIPLIALAACGGNDVSLTNASPQEVASKVDAAGGLRFKPGKWEITVQTLAVDIPGLDPATKKQMSDTMLKKSQTTASCITSEQAKSPPAEVIARSQGRCKYEKFEIDGGSIDGTLVCPAQGAGGPMKMRVAGTFDETSFMIDNDMESAAPNGPAIKIKAKSSGKRIGDCTAQEEKQADADAKG